MTDDNTAASGKVQFIDSHIPALEAGDYTITVEQIIKHEDTDINKQIGKYDDADKKKFIGETFSLQQKSQKFSVLSPRFSLDPQEIQAVFPPPGSLGEHSNVLPHIILNRSTLPWERSADGKAGVPWLALLLFDEDEAPQPIDPAKQKSPPVSILQTITLEDLKKATTEKFPKVYDRGLRPKAAVLPNLELEYGDDDKNPLAVIDVPKKLLSEILPSKDELRLLAHVRQTEDATGKAQGDEASVIICNRLPQKNNMSFVHLVSIEGRYGEDGFDYQNAGDTDLVRLVSLYSWRFACLSPRHSFKGLLMHLNHQLLFNLPIKAKSDEVVSYLSNIDDVTLLMPDRLTQAFLQSAQPLSGKIAFKDQSTWKITEGNKSYFVSKTSQKIYDQAGRDTQKTTSVSDPETVRTKAAKLLNLKAEAKITVDNTHWWLGIKQPEYFLSEESTILFVYHLDPDSSSTLRLPNLKSKDENANNLAKPYLAMGCVPLPHKMRQGNTSVSWYHGPLIPGSKNEDVDLPIRSADELMRYNQTTGMFDLSYSAAWELGRLLMLENKRASVDLLNWKRGHAQSIKDAEGRLAHLPFEYSTALGLPESVQTWFEDLALLKNLPFSYLVPDERMLPTEAIRFFQVDSSWVECLLDGAFSIGRVLPADHRLDDKLKVHLPGERKMSGFLLRSDVVSGWPGLLVDGYPDAYSGNENIPEMQELFSASNTEFRTHLINKQIKKIQEALSKENIWLSSACAIDMTTTGWLIADETNQKYYSVLDQDNGKDVKVYRENKLRLVRMDRLSKNVLLCLFDGVIQTVDIHLKPETLHFGVNAGDEKHKGVKWYKSKRNDSGKELDLGNDPDNTLQTWVEVINDTNRNAINIADLAAKLTTSNNSAEFALQMIEAAEKVRFVQKASS